MADMSPNSWVLTGRGIHVTYTESGIDGKPRLTYQNASQSRSFAGSEIRTATTDDLGTTVSVSIMTTVDQGYTSFTLLLPRTVLPNGQASPVHVLGITGVHRGGIVVPSHGQMDTFTTVPLTGTAAVVESLA